MLELFWWLTIFVLLYHYFGYPLLLLLSPIFFPNRPSKTPYDCRISVLLPVWNEEKNVAQKIQNILESDFPASQMELLVGSDASEDNTDAIVKKINAPHLHFYPFKQRQGKAAILNHLVKKSTGDILVFCDARQRFASNAIKSLVDNFSDPMVGDVSAVFKLPKQNTMTQKGLNVYWHYENTLREMESRIHSMLGSTGAFHAMRKCLFTPIPKTIILDDMYSVFSLIQRGYRSVIDNEVLCIESWPGNYQSEQWRKVRTTFGLCQLTSYFPGLFIPIRSPIAIQLISHKYLRLLVPFLLFALFTLNVPLLAAHDFYHWSIIAQVIFYTLAITGMTHHRIKRNFKKTLPPYWEKRLENICFIPLTFCFFNFSILLGLFYYLIGKTPPWRKL